MNNNRFIAFDILKLFAIFLVIYGHCILHLQNHSYDIKENIMYRFVASFHMPLFMAISGYFGSKIFNLKFSDLFKKKWNRLIVPSISFGIIFSLSWCYIIEGGGSYIETFIKCYWFLKSAFCCSLLYWAYRRIPNQIIGLILTLAISQFVFMYKVNEMYPAFLVGAFLYNHKIFLEKNWLSIFLPCLIIYLILFSFDDYEMFSYPVLRLHKYLKSPEISFYLSIHAYVIAMGIFGALSVVSLFIGIGRILPHMKTGEYISRWGSETLGIYLIQAILLEHFLMRTLDFSDISWSLFNLVIAPIIAIIVIILCLIIIYGMKRSRFLRIYFLGENK